MAFGRISGSLGTTPMSEINIIPMVDVMLVLLVIFIITAPLLTHAVKIDLPRASSSPNLTKPENIQIAVNASGQVFWNGEAVDRPTLGARMRSAGAQSPTPELHLHADKDTRYETLADIMSEASRTGLSRIGFVSAPAAAGDAR